MYSRHYGHGDRGRRCGHGGHGDDANSCHSFTFRWADSNNEIDHYSTDDVDDVYSSDDNSSMGQASHDRPGASRLDRSRATMQTDGDVGRRREREARAGRTGDIFLQSALDNERREWRRVGALHATAAAAGSSIVSGGMSGGRGIGRPEIGLEGLAGRMGAGPSGAGLRGSLGVGRRGGGSMGGYTAHERERGQATGSHGMDGRFGTGNGGGRDLSPDWDEARRRDPRTRPHGPTDRWGFYGPNRPSGHYDDARGNRGGHGSRAGGRGGRSVHGAFGLGHDEGDSY